MRKIRPTFDRPHNDVESALTVNAAEHFGVMMLNFACGETFRP